MLESCWELHAHERPQIDDVYDVLEDVAEALVSIVLKRLCY